MTITPYNSNNSLAPEFIWTSFEMDELINIRLRLKKDLYLWSKFCLGPKIQTEDRHTIRNPRQKLQLIHYPLCFQNPPIHSIYRKNPHESVRFLRPNPSIRKPIHPPSSKDPGLNFVCRWCRSFQSWHSLKEKAIIFQQRQMIKLTGSLTPLMSASKPISLFCFVADALVVVVFEVVVVVFAICCSQQYSYFKQRK